MNVCNSAPLPSLIKDAILSIDFVADPLSLLLEFFVLLVLSDFLGFFFVTTSWVGGIRAAAKIGVGLCLPTLDTVDEAVFLPAT